MTARAGVLAMSIVACTHPRPPVTGAELERVQRWWIVIGHSPVLESLDWRHYARDAQMVVVSGDPRIPISDFGFGAAFPLNVDNNRTGKFWAFNLEIYAGT